MQLEVFLATWRESRDPRLATMIARLGGEPDPEVASQFANLRPPALLKATIDALQPTNATYALASLVPVVDRVVREAKGSWPLVELIAELPPDPRLACLGLALVADFHALKYTSAKLLRRLFDVIEHHGDPSCIAPLEALRLIDPAPATTTRIAHLVKRLARSRALSDEQLQELQTTTIEPVSPAGTALLEAVYADPASDAARAVYADYLISQADPRGELIHLQLVRAAGTATDATIKRETALLRKYATTWLGPFAKLLQPNHKLRARELLPSELMVPIDNLQGTTFARGFVRRLSPLYVPKSRSGIYDEPMWSTVEHVVGVSKLTPMMRSLRHVDHATPEMLALDRSWDSLGFSMRDLREAKVLANVRTRRLELAVSWGDFERVTDVIRAATTGNEMVKEIVLVGDAPKALERTYGWRTIGLAYVDRITLATNVGDVAIDLTNNHVDVYPTGFDAMTWQCVLGGIWDPFETATVHHVTDEDGRAALGYARQFKIATSIIDAS